MFARHVAIAFAALVGITCGCSHPSAVHTELAVAAAANLTDVLGTLGPAFEAKTGIHPVFSFASTAQLTQQIEHAAPFDVFLSADASHVDQLDQEHLLASGSRAVYAIGVLALWIPPKSEALINNAVNGIADLLSPSVSNIAIAKPELAPYGAAAVASLKAAGIWDKVEPKVVYAENISMARQYGDSGNASAVFTAYSLVRKDAGKVIQVDEKLHSPIEQALGIIAASAHQAEARQFTDYLLKGAGRGTLREFGYGIPAR